LGIEGKAILLFCWFALVPEVVVVVVVVVVVGPEP